uniref:Carbonic anhydrase n=1 Tax=Petromyzon marinus TaxID=7757 RepID=A0AAJ7SPX1_PETMA
TGSASTPTPTPSTAHRLAWVNRTSASGDAHWCYDSQDSECGPRTWYKNSPTCSGTSQSPIDIHTGSVKRNATLQKLKFIGYDSTPAGVTWSIQNNGHTVQVDLQGEIAVSGGGLPGTFNAVQMHFHWGNPHGPGSEHTINGKQFPVELHIVHYNTKYLTFDGAKNEKDGLAVLGFLYAVGPTNNNYNTIINALPSVANQGQKLNFSSTFNLDNLLPSYVNMSKYYRYSGSLTTPGCGEVVTWTVFEEPIIMDENQIKKFSSVFFSTKEDPQQILMVNNFRPVQKLNSRIVYASETATVGSAVPLVVNKFTHAAGLFLLAIVLY